MEGAEHPSVAAQRVERQPVLVISHEIIGARMAGPGIRYYHLARVLAHEFPVVLAAPTGSVPVQTNPIEPSMLVYASGQDVALEKAISEARAILVPAVVFTQIPALLRADAPLIIDGYDPFLAETLYLTTETTTQQAALTQAYLAGDFFVCASERQRDWWLGVLEALGRVNAQTYAEDHSLRKLVDLVPFGLPELQPQHTRPMVKGIIPGIGENDRVVLWGGGLWQWLDPLTAIRAISKIAERRQDVRLFFPGAQHPNPGMAGLATHYPAARDLANQLGLLNRFVFFGDWVSYDDWQNVLLESDVALTLHQNDTLESRLAFRSRVLDYLWASVPVIATRGDATSELIAANDIGLLVDGQDVDGVARAIVRLIDTPRSTFAEKFRIIHQTMTWERAALPLIEFCRRPRRAPDKVALGDQLGNPWYLDRIAQLQSENARLRNLVDTYEQRRVVRLLNRVVEIKKRLD
jgi:glycosyltransferase involved in cell wall biosynthesis